MLGRGSRSRLGRSAGRPHFRRSAGPDGRSFASPGSNTGRRRRASCGRGGPHSGRRCRPRRGGCRRLFPPPYSSMSHDRGGRPRRWRRGHCLARLDPDLIQGPRHGTRFGAGFARLPRLSWRRRSSHSGAMRDRLDWYCRGPLCRGRGLRRRRRNGLRNCRSFLCALRLRDLLLAGRVEALAHLIGNIFIEGARMRLLVRDADLGQIVGDNLRFDFELARQLVNSNFAHLCFLIL